MKKCIKPVNTLIKIELYWLAQILIEMMESKDWDHLGEAYQNLLRLDQILEIKKVIKIFLILKKKLE